MRARARMLLWVRVGGSENGCGLCVCVCVCMRACVRVRASVCPQKKKKNETRMTASALNLLCSWFETSVCLRKV